MTESNKTDSSATITGPRRLLKTLFLSLVVLLLSVPIIELFWVDRVSLSPSHPVQRCFIKFGNLAAFLPPGALNPQAFDQSTHVEKRFGFDDFVTSIKRRHLPDNANQNHSFGSVRMSLQKHSSSVEQYLFRELSWLARGFHLTKQRGFQQQQQQLDGFSDYDFVRIATLHKGDVIVGQRIQIQKQRCLLNLEIHGLWCEDSGSIDSLFGKKLKRFLKTQL